jgi:hypothetical protein
MAPSDDNSPYDDTVADAPEDMPRVGNDHEALHNAKLSPDGYYDGFFHKDYQGNYAQRHRHHKKHNKRRLNRGRFVQMKDHKMDTDDIVPEADWVQHKFEHNNDTDDVVVEFSDMADIQYEHENDSDDVVQEFSDMDEDQQKRGSATERLQ